MKRENVVFTAQAVRAETTGAVCIICEGKHEGKSLRRTLSLSNFISLLQDTVTELEGTVRIGELPDGYVDGYVSRKSSNSFGVIIKVPGVKRQMVLNIKGRRKAYYIPYPNLVYLIKIHRGEPTAMKCYCYKTWQGSKTPLYQFPFGNVSSEGSVCNGSVVYPTLQNIMDVESLIDCSLNGETNNDYLGLGGNARVTKSYTQFELCEYLETQEVFPEELLREQPGNVTSVALLQQELCK